MGEPHEVLLCMQGKRDGALQQLAVFEGMGADGTRVAHLRSTDLGRAHAAPVPPRARTSGVEDRRPRTSPSLPTGTTASPREETDKAAKGASAPAASRPESTQSRRVLFASRLPLLTVKAGSFQTRKVTSIHKDMG